MAAPYLHFYAHRLFSRRYIFAGVSGAILLTFFGAFPGDTERPYDGSNPFGLKGHAQAFAPLIGYVTNYLNRSPFPEKKDKQRDVLSRLQWSVQSWFDNHKSDLVELQKELVPPAKGEYFSNHVIYTDPQQRFSIVIRRYSGSTAIMEERNNVGFVIPIEDGMYEQTFENGNDENEGWVELPKGMSHPLKKGKVTTFADVLNKNHQIKGEGSIIEIHFTPLENRGVVRYVPHVSGDGRYLASTVAPEDVTHRLSYVVQKEMGTYLYGDNAQQALMAAGETAIYSPLGFAVPASAVTDALKRFPHSIVLANGPSLMLDIRGGNHTEVLRYWAKKKLELTKKFDTSVVKTEINDGVATLTINRLENSNVLSADVKIALYQAIKSLEKNDKVNSILITGAGEKVFVAGGDLAAMQNLRKEGGNREEPVLMTQLVFEAIKQCKKPTVAVINGVAFGGGNELAMATRYRLAVRGAKIAQTEINLALIPGAGLRRLVRLIGPRNAAILALTGASLTADQALAIGLIDEIVEPGQLVSRGREIAKSLSENTFVLRSWL
jgi:enoyl-CoA hydratase